MSIEHQLAQAADQQGRVNPNDPIVKLLRVAAEQIRTLKAEGRRFRMERNVDRMMKEALLARAKLAERLLDDFLGS